MVGGQDQTQDLALAREALVLLSSSPSPEAAEQTANLEMLALIHKGIPTVTVNLTNMLKSVKKKIYMMRNAKEKISDPEKNINSWARRRMPVMPALERLRHEDFCEFEAGLDYKTRPCLKQNKPNQTTTEK